jgi:hypothetical protein
LENNDAKIHIFLEPTRKNGNKTFHTISFQNICFICFHLQPTEYESVAGGADENRWKQYESRWGLG